MNQPQSVSPPANPNVLPGKHRLTAEQLRDFERNGFFILRGALTGEEIEHLTAVTDRADRELTQHVKGSRSPGSPLELRNAIAFDPALLAMLTHPVGFPLILDLMGPAIALTTSHLFIRPPSAPDTARTHKQIDWHRDGPNPRPQQERGIEPWLYTKIGYFFTDTTIPDSGALRVVPGSHRYGGPPPHSGLDGEDPYGAIEVKLQAGDAVIFENRVLHAVGPNYSTVSRKNLYLGYCWRYLRPIDYLAQDGGLLRRADDFQKQLLGDVPSALHFYLPGKDGLPLSRWNEMHVSAP